MNIGPFPIVFLTASAASAFAKEIIPSLNLIISLRGEFMAAIDDINAAIAAERTEVQGKLKDLADKITALEGQVLTPEKAAELISGINNISEPVGPPGPPA